MYLPPMPMFKLNFVIPLTAKSITHCKSWLYLEILIFFLCEDGGLDTVFLLSRYCSFTAGVLESASMPSFYFVMY